MEYFIQQEFDFIDSLSEKEYIEYEKFVAEIKIRRFLMPWLIKFMTKKHGKDWKKIIRQRELRRKENLDYYYYLMTC